MFVKLMTIDQLCPNTFGWELCRDWGLAAVLQEKASSIQKQLLSTVQSLYVTLTWQKAQK